MSTLVRDAAAPFQEIVGSLEGNLGLPAYAGSLLTRRVDEWEAQRLIAGITAVHSARFAKASTVAAALDWFTGGRLNEAGPQLSPACARLRWASEPTDHLVALLPYVLDPYGETTRRAVISGRGCSDERATRKAVGTFYTPGDVARSLADEVVTRDTRHVLDPACGAGVFLRAAFSAMADSRYAADAAMRLYGVDVDGSAANACALVLLHDWLMREPLVDDEVPVDRFRLLRANIIRADALQVFAEEPQLTTDCPRSAITGGLPSRFDAVLVNPPFARTGPRARAVRGSYASLRATNNPEGTNLMWPFWELCSRVTASAGRAGIVLPLAASYADAPSARAGRRAVFSRGAWGLRFFDRTPDSLFGDDVKQRIAIAVRSEGQPRSLTVSSLRRWSADARVTALRGSARGHVTISASDGVIPKIGTQAERDALRALSAMEQSLGDAATSVRLVRTHELDSSVSSVVVAPTAYNWIGAYRDVSLATAGRAQASSKLVELVFRSPSEADAAYGFLVSRVFLWWWRAVGDLFHVSRAILSRAPFPLHALDGNALSRVAMHGQRCWTLALAAPRIAVNKGVTTVAYTPEGNDTALELLDRAVGRALELPDDFVRFTGHDARRLRSAGRTTRVSDAQHAAEGTEPPH